MKVLLIDDNHEILKEGLQNLGYKCEEDFTSTKEEIELKIHEYTGIIIRSRFNLDESFLSKASKLKFIGRVGAGLENIDVKYAEYKSIFLAAAPEGNRNALGEHALGMLLCLFNKLNIVDQEVRSGLWEREANRGLELEGKTVGIIGYGNMGKSFAKKLRGFDVKVLCYDIKENVGNEDAQQVEMSKLYEEADILSLHTPLTPATTNLINRSFIQNFKKPIYIVNTARGKSLVTEDLIYSLELGLVKGAALDVLEYEKTSFESLFKTDMPQAFKSLIASNKVLLSPHIGGWTIESKVKLAEVIVEKISKEFHSKIQK